MGGPAEAAAVAHASPAHVDEVGTEEAEEPNEKGVSSEAVAVEAVLPAKAAKVAKGGGSPPTSKGKGAKASGKAAMAMVLGAVAKRDAAKDVAKKRPAAASGGKAKSAKTVGEATYGCEWSREQFMGRTGESGSGTTKRFLWKEYGGMEKALKACKAWCADINAKRKP